MARRREGVARWRRELSKEEHTELVHSIQELQIQVHGLSARVFIALEILAEQQL
jgi:hypothetical protein